MQIPTRSPADLGLGKAHSYGRRDPLMARRSSSFPRPARPHPAFGDQRGEEGRDGGRRRPLIHVRGGNCLNLFPPIGFNLPLFLFSTHLEPLQSQTIPLQLIEGPYIAELYGRRAGGRRERSLPRSTRVMDT